MRLPHSTRPNSIGVSTNYCDEGEHEYLGRKLYSWGSAIKDPLFKLASFTLWQGEENDALVALCSMKFGKWLGAVDGDHLLPIGGIVGQISKEQKLMVQEIFLAHARRLGKNGA